ncbi:MAG: superoxide dismutase [Opitutales bacterium]
MNRRTAIKTGLISSLGVFASTSSIHAMANAKNSASGPGLGPDPLVDGLRYPYQLPKLAFEHAAFEPQIDAETMRIHHGRHHAGYVRKLNAALESLPEWRDVPLNRLLARLDELPASQREALRNNGGGHLNHTIYWSTMRPGGSAAEGAFAAAVQRDFGGVAQLREALAAAGGGRFGSGWAWLTVAPDGQLAVTSTPNQDNPVMVGAHPLFGVDVWEHAYYLNYQNRRGDYIQAYLDLADWTAVSKRYSVLTGA